MWDKDKKCRKGQDEKLLCVYLYSRDCITFVMLVEET